MLSGLSAPLTLTWLDDEEKTLGVSAPLDIWVAQIVLALPPDVITTLMDAVVAEVERINALIEEEDLDEEEDQDEDSA